MEAIHEVIVAVVVVRPILGARVVEHRLQVPLKMSDGIKFLRIGLYRCDQHVFWTSFFVVERKSSQPNRLANAL